MTTPEKKEFSITVFNCARCGDRHDCLTFYPFTNAPDEYEFYAMCPTTIQPVLMATGSDEIFRNFEKVS